MIRRVRSDRESFRDVEFEEGFNVILAERTQESGEKDSRNGTGKTSLIEIIHFCLGSNIEPKDTLKAEELRGWTFLLDITLRGKEYTISRNTSDQQNVEVAGDFSSWPVRPVFDDERDSHVLRNKDWRSLLGHLMFDLPMTTDEKYAPTFRSLISYFIRRRIEAFQNPFKHFPQQKEWDIQVDNAFLLGLNWEYAARFQEMKDREKTLQILKSAAEEGLLTGYFGSIGELEAERVRSEERIDEMEKELNNFKVHPQYHDIEEEANKLTKEIHETANKNVLDVQILRTYEESVAEEEDVPADKVRRIYDEAGLIFSDKTIRELNDIMNFHRSVIENRKIYLQSEMERISREIKDQESRIELLSDERSELLSILKTHGALDEFSNLQTRATALRQQLEEIKMRIQNLKKFEEGKSSLKIEKESLLQEARRDFEERRVQRDRAISYFNGNSEKLYSEPGTLSIDVTESGYKFGVDIKGARSTGIGYMKVFCYDLMLSQLRAGYQDMPGFLIHDSTIFDGVDERQIAKAMETAAEESERRGFQYICAVNSDRVPYDDFSEEFGNRFSDHKRIELTDAEEGRLFRKKF
jgi:uncharacterized protein YydD (DUF2326 family)